MTSQAGGKRSATGCAAGPAIPAGARTRARPATRPAAVPGCPGGPPGSHAATAARTAATSRPALTSPAATSPRPAAMVIAPCGAARVSPRSASSPPAGAPATRTCRSPRRRSVPGFRGPPPRPAGRPWAWTPAPGPRSTTPDPPPRISPPRASTQTPTWRILMSSPGSGRTCRRRKPGSARRTRPRAAGGRPAAGATTMTTTGRARNGTSSPTSSTGLSCPPTSRWPPRPAARSPAAQPLP